MKKLLLFILLITPPCWSAPTLVQHASCSSGQANTFTAYTCPLPNIVLSGNIVIVGVNNAAAGTPSSVADDKGNTYTVGPVAADANQKNSIYFAVNVTNGPRVITVNFSSAIGFVSAVVSEYYNVATSSPIDGTCSGGTGTGCSNNSGSSTSATPGSITTATAGDLIYSFANADDGINVGSWAANASFALLNADRRSPGSGNAVQTEVQVSAGAVNPAFTLGESHPWVDVQVAFKAAVAGTAPSAGIKVKSVQHFNISGAGPGGDSSPFTIQFPCSGTGIVLTWIGVPGLDISSIASTPSNTWTSTGAVVSNGSSGDVQIFYVKNASCSATMTVTVTTTGSYDSTPLLLFDVTGNDTVNFFNTRGTATGNETSGTSFVGANVTPGTSNGLLIGALGVDHDTVVDVSPGFFLSDVGTPHPTIAPNDNNNGHRNYYNPNTSNVSNTWTNDVFVGVWADVLAAFDAAPVGGSVVCKRSLLGVGC